MLCVVHFSPVSQGSLYSAAPWAPMLFQYLCQVMVLRWSSYQTCPWRWALLCNFLCSVSWWQLAQGCVSLWDSLQDFWCNTFYTKRMQSCSCVLLASHYQAERASLRLQQSHKLVRQLRQRCAADGSFPCWLFHPSETVLQASLERCFSSPLLLPPDSALIVLFPEELRSSLEDSSYFQSLSFVHPRNMAHKIKLKHRRFLGFVQFIMFKDVWNGTLRHSLLFPGYKIVVYLHLPACPSTLCLHSRN